MAAGKPAIDDTVRESGAEALFVHTFLPATPLAWTPKSL